MLRLVVVSALLLLVRGATFSRTPTMRMLATPRSSALPLVRGAAWPTRTTTTRMSATPPIKEVVVVGGGWAGYTVADALSKSPGVRVTLLEASQNAGGLAGGWRTPGGRPVEAGIHGFWREYRNTFAAMESIGLSVDDVLTPFTPSVLVSQSGKVATAPVLGSVPSNTAGPQTAVPLPFAPEALMLKISELLPPPLDTALLAEFAPGSRLTPADRASAIGLLPVWADFRQEERDSWLRYDEVTAEDLFKQCVHIFIHIYVCIYIISGSPSALVGGWIGRNRVNHVLRYPFGSWPPTRLWEVVRTVAAPPLIVV